MGLELVMQMQHDRIKMKLKDKINYNGIDLTPWLNPGAEPG